MKLFEPLDIGSMVIPNRIMVPAMVTRLSGEDGFVNQAISDRYARYAQGGVGLVVVEAMAVHHAKSGPLLRISDDKYVPGLRDLVQRIHDTSESKVVPQIIHFMKVARSGWRQTVDTLAPQEIDRSSSSSATRCARARMAGFDGAELHSAHAYTLASFFSRANPRTDEYGGDTLEGRLRLIGRVMENIRRKAGADFPVCIRYHRRGIHQGRLHRGRLQADRAAARPARLRLPLAVGRRQVRGRDPRARRGAVSVHRLFGRPLHAGRLVSAGAARAPRAEIRAFVAHGYDVPVAIAGKISDPDDAEASSRSARPTSSASRAGCSPTRLAEQGARGERDRIVHCDYCNFCKDLDGTHKEVVCSLWPQGAMQAPADDRSARAAMGRGRRQLWRPSATARRR